MALTAFQRSVCRILADTRVASGESYVAGGVALNELIAGPRISADLDLFHDTDEALARSWDADRRLLETNGFDVAVLRERRAFVEAEVRRGDDHVRVEWARDSAYRFFPLVRHEEFGLVLHPFDLATNKVLALIGRLEARDWVDVLASDRQIQPLGYLSWAACAKDPGFGPGAILDAAARSAHYSAEEIAQLAFDGPPPDASALAQAWRRALAEAAAVVAVLPPEHSGTCVLAADGRLFRGTAADLAAALGSGSLRFHAGRIRGALPQIVC